MIPNDNPQTPEPLSPERLAEIRQGQPTDWLPARWSIHQIDGDGETASDYWQVCHGGTVLATLPDWAGNLALWMANSPDDIRDLLAEVVRLTARVAELERPEIERKRNEVRDSYRLCAAQAEEDRDYEGRDHVLMQLGARETAWAAEDAKAGAR